MPVHNKRLPYALPFFFLISIIIQISIGAFVSGLDAGRIYQSWPLMNGSFFPDDSNIRDLFSLNSFETPSIVQFVHRNLAYLIFLFFLFIVLVVFKNDDYFHLRKITFLILCFLTLQIFLGIITVLSDINIFLASIHQMGSIFLVIASLILIFKNSRIS